MIGAILLALAPVFIIAFYIYFRDKYEKEPWPILLLSMLAGVVITLPITFAEEFMAFLGGGFDGIFKTFWDSFLVAAFCEEGFKLIVLVLLIWKSKEFNEKFDGIVYASFISLGFAGIENLMYVLKSGLGTGIFRAFSAVPAHAIFGISMGFFFAMAKFYPQKRRKYLWYTFLLPFFLHGFYDFILLSGYNVLLLIFIPFVLFLWISGFRKMKKMNNASIFRNDLDIGLYFCKVKEYKPDERS
ncbi:MAG TPA: PrsW family glutamic-type intramembrane protease [Prolixibacteraceae bacterium]|nr:PrsW family glutamic-type intramembrane protease [Prolixibacteraceae bacterium]